MSIPSLSYECKLKKPFNKWTKDEDSKLLTLCENIKKTNWKYISTFFNDKNSMQCFSRYKRIHPEIKKGKWDEEEDKRVCCLYEKYGNKWYKIAKEMKNRNPKQVRDRIINYHISGIKKDKFSFSEDKAIVNFYRDMGPLWTKMSKLIPGRTPHMIKNRFYCYIYQNLNKLKQDLKPKPIFNIEKIPREKEFHIKHDNIFESSNEFLTFPNHKEMFIQFEGNSNDSTNPKSNNNMLYLDYFEDRISSND